MIRAIFLMFSIFFINVLYSQNSQVKEILSYVYPASMNREQFYDHYNGGIEPVDVQTFRYIEHLGLDDKERYKVRVRKFTQMNGGLMKGAIIINEYSISAAGIQIERAETQKSPLGNNGAVNYQDGPFHFKMPKKGQVITWSFWEDNQRNVFSSEYVKLKVDDKIYVSIRITQKHYDKAGKLIVSPLYNYYVKGVGLWKITMGTGEKLYLQLQDAENYLVEGQNGEVVEVINQKVKRGREKPVGYQPKAIMPKRGS
jgi:hypothetical protein